ncbi:MAG: sigma factor, partial [Pseudomonadota bacterium]|nr:sigma factor [Pseudomonadota bacterium]
MADPSDEDLLARVAVGDGDAFETFMERHLSAIGGYARRMLGPTAADDVTQECFLRIWRAAAGRAAPAPARAWMWRIAHNLVMDQVRAAKPHIDPDSVNLVEDRPGPEARRQSNEVAEVLRREIAALPARPRAARGRGPDQVFAAAEGAGILVVAGAGVVSLLGRAPR